MMTRKEELIQFIQETPDNEMVILKERISGILETFLNRMVMTLEDSIIYIEKTFDESLISLDEERTITVKNWVRGPKTFQAIEIELPPMPEGREE